MKKIEDYFQQQSSDNDLFLPEYLCAKAIREKLDSLRFIPHKDAEDILAIFNKANSEDHYDGSGWSDYQLHLRALLSLNNLKVDVDNTGRMLIQGKA